MASSQSTQQEMTVEGLRALANKYTKNAGECDSVGAFLKKQGSNTHWQSGAASTFKTSMAKYQKALGALHDDFTTLAKEVGRRADVLAVSQKE